MNRILISCALFLGVTFFSSAQNYSYSFKGDIDSLEVVNLAERLSHLEGVEVIKARFKVEKSAGEFLIYLSEVKDKTKPNPFNATQIKAVLIENNLTPLQFKAIPTK